jgi:hypothetical protein
LVNLGDKLLNGVLIRQTNIFYYFY